MIKYAIVAGGLIIISIIAFYYVGVQPTNIELNNGYNLFNQNVTEINQTGTTDPNAKLTINGEPVIVDKNGNFSEIIYLKDGQNIINITAKAPFESQTQTYAIVNRIVDKNGASGTWAWNDTIKAQQ